MIKKNIFLIMESIIILLLSGSILYFINTQQKSKEEIENLKEKIEDLQKQQTVIDSDKDTIPEIDENKIKKEAIQLIEDLDIYYMIQNEIEDFNDINNNDKLWLMLGNISKFSGKDRIEDADPETILKGMKKLLGNNFTINFEDIYSPNDSVEPAYIYDKNTKKYRANLGFSLDKFISFKMEATQLKKDKDFYYITYKPLIYVEGVGCDVNIDFINSKEEKIYTYNLVDNNPICKSSDLSSDIIEEAYTKAKTKLSDVTYKFKILNNNLVLVGIEK